MAIKLDTPRFGILEVKESELILFPDGMLGFPDLKRYIMLDNPGGGPFRWLQSVEMPAIAFVTCDPLQFFPDYRVSIRREDLIPIKLEDSGHGYVLVVITIRANVLESTANLAGPVIINVQEGLARQIVLNDAAYHTRHPLVTPPVKGAGTDAGSHPVS